MGKKGILLAFVETVDFIDKENGLSVILWPCLFSLGNDASDLFDPGEDR